MSRPRFDLYEAKDGWRWRLLASNGRIQAESGEAYTRRHDAMRAIRQVRSIAPKALIPTTEKQRVKNGKALKIPKPVFSDLAPPWPESLQ